MASVTVWGRKPDFLGVVSGYEEMDDTGIFAMRAGDCLSLLVPDDNGTFEIVIQL